MGCNFIDSDLYTYQLPLRVSVLAKLTFFTKNVDAENQTLINHKTVCKARNPAFCKCAVSRRFSVCQLYHLLFCICHFIQFVICVKIIIVLCIFWYKFYCVTHHNKFLRLKAKDFVRLSISTSPSCF